MVLIIETFIFFVPAAVANMAPVLARKIHFLNYPVDFGQKLFGKRITGNHKTWRGFFFGFVFTYIFLLLLMSFSKETFLEYFLLENIFLLAILYTLGALGGDAVGSLLKRQMNITEGKPLWLVDQINWVIGTLVLFNLFFTIPIVFWLVGPIIFIPLHLLTNVFSFLIGFRETFF